MVQDLPHDVFCDAGPPLHEFTRHLRKASEKSAPKQHAAILHRGQPHVRCKRAGFSISLRSRGRGNGVRGASMYSVCIRAPRQVAHLSAAGRVAAELHEAEAATIEVPDEGVPRVICVQASQTSLP